MAEPQRESERKGVASFKAGAEATGGAEDEQQVVVTISSAMGRIVKVEKPTRPGSGRNSPRKTWRNLLVKMRQKKLKALLKKLSRLALLLCSVKSTKPMKRTRTTRRGRFGECFSADSCAVPSGDEFFSDLC